MKAAFDSRINNLFARQCHDKVPEALCKICHEIELAGVKRIAASFFSKCQKFIVTNWEDPWDPSSVHKSNESIIKLQLITDGYFYNSKAWILEVYVFLITKFLFQHDVQSLLVIWQYFMVRKFLFLWCYFLLINK